MNEDQPLLVMRKLSKSFPGVLALDDVSLTVNRGEVHALVGQNGAGKSTLIKILTGVYRRDRGEIHFDGQSVTFHSPHHAQAGGVSTIYQEINLVPLRSVSENIFLGREPRRWGLIDWRRMNADGREILGRFNINIDVSKPLAEYNIAVQQMTAIARAVSIHSKLVIMDEPTSSLDDREVEALFEVIRQLKAAGVSVIFISHRLDELFAICDRVTVMRDGRSIGVKPMSETSKLELVSMMLGKTMGTVRNQGLTGFGEHRREAGASVLEAEGLRRRPALRNASFGVRAGETVGLAGLLGAGRTETARAVFGADRLEAGEVRIDGKVVSFASPADAIRAGIGFCSEDRMTEGIVPDMSVRENLTLALLPALARHGVVDAVKQDELVNRFIERLGIKATGPDQKIRELSGGNQQKVLLARWMCLSPRLLILDEPTRGIDVGAKAEIQALINELAGDGLGVLMISSELDELVEGSDRVVVLRDGQTVAAIPREDLSEAAIMDAMAHGSDQRVPSGEEHG
jgi:monosaccharide-transporting ATPase